ncbi:MAG: hypothetical protein AAFR64_06355 [Pseudomonadota bacterium]
MTKSVSSRSRRKSLALGALALFAIGGTGTAIAQGALNADSLKVDGLNYETELKAIFLGDLGNARIEPESMRFTGLVDSYIEAYARQCDKYLPTNKVELTEQVCTGETVTRNGFGVEINRYCSSWQTVGRGLYADPVILNANGKIKQRLFPGQIVSMIGIDKSSNPIEAQRQMVDIVLSFGDDMPRLLNTNGCASAATKRLEANLVKMATGERGLKLASGATLASTREASTGAAFVDSNYGKMIDELIVENSRGWMFNRYVQGSTNGVSVTQRDGEGRPVSISASYRFTQLGSPQRGSVRLTFEDGLPKCLYFFDAPNTCRLPSRRIMTAYEKGEYR